MDYEILLVDDGSTDRTWDLIRTYHRRDRRWKGLRLARNFGQQAAIGAGLHAARGRAVVLLDADLQDPPELIADFLDHWRRGWQVVYGVRAERPEGWWKQLGYRGFYWLLKRCSPTPIPLDAGDFCLMDRRVAAALRSCPEQRPFWRGLRAWVGFRQLGVPYARHSRQAGQSQYTFRKLLRLAADGFDSMTTAAPTAALLLALMAAVTLLSGWLVGGTAQSAALTIGAAVQCLILALLVRQQVRSLEELRRRPRWVVAGRIGLAAAPKRRHLQAA
jgi:dolichol-phosphate mannosyltransferase